MQGYQLFKEAWSKVMDYLTGLIIYYSGFMLTFIFMLILKYRKSSAVEGVNACTFTICSFFWFIFLPMVFIVFFANFLGHPQSKQTGYF